MGGIAGDVLSFANAIGSNLLADKEVGDR